MTLEQAIAAQSGWLTYWVTWLFFATFILPLSLLIWRQSRWIAVIIVLSSVVAGFAIQMIYTQMGYVRLLGLPHILVWTPLVYVLMRWIRASDLPVWPRRILMVILASILVSLAFDYVDLVRYFLGERTPFTMPG